MLRRTNRMMDGAPYLFGPQRNVDVANTKWFERIEHRIGDSRRRADGRRFANALDAKRIQRRGRLGAVQAEVRELVGSGYGVVHQRAAEKLALFVVDDFFQ